MSITYYGSGRPDRAKHDDAVAQVARNRRLGIALIGFAAALFLGSILFVAARG